MLRILKEDNFGDTNEFYLTLHKENSKMGRRQEAFIGERVYNKKEKTKYLGWEETTK